RANQRFLTANRRRIVQGTSLADGALAGGRCAMFLRGIPLLILALFAADVALSAAPLIDQLAGSPFNRLRNFIDVSREASLPTWYSSMQWFCAGVLFALAPLYAWRRRLPGMAALAGLALVCLVFSADEVA